MLFKHHKSLIHVIMNSIFEEFESKFRMNRYSIEIDCFSSLPRVEVEIALSPEVNGPLFF